MTGSQEIMCLCGWLAHEAGYSDEAMVLYAEAESIDVMEVGLAALWTHFVSMRSKLTSQQPLFSSMLETA